MKNMYIEKIILFLTDVPYVIFGSGAGTTSASDIFVNNYNIVNMEK